MEVTGENVAFLQNDQEKKAKNGKKLSKMKKRRKKYFFLKLFKIEKEKKY